MKYTSPEQKGISSENIKKYIDVLEEHNFATHNVIIARGDSIVYEKYWEPFSENFLHRMYSVSKSFVSIAVGFAQQDGLLSLDDTMIKHFPDELANQRDENLKNQTVRDMLMMCTAKEDPGITREVTDRVRAYFENKSPFSRATGKIFSYDSTGSFVLGALVERLTGMELMKYLRVKLFDKIGISKEVYCLKSPGGHSWGDSAVMCTPKDLLLVARFCMNKGKWNGEQILDEKYITDAVSKQVDNNMLNEVSYNRFGYGYLFWRTYDNSYFFNGMGDQLAVCVPDKDIILVYNGDNQGNNMSREIIIKNFFELISRTAKDCPLEENPKMLDVLKNEKKKLLCTVGQLTSPIQKRIDGKEYMVSVPNAMGIKKFSLHFGEEKCIFRYTNDQGEKELYFGMGKNVFDKFPQDGYGVDFTMVPIEGYRYNCAVSAAWLEKDKLYLGVQIIDKYFGRLHISFGFKDENTVGIYMSKTAEFFLDEYSGYAIGVSAKNSL